MRQFTVACQNSDIKTINRQWNKAVFNNNQRMSGQGYEGISRHRSGVLEGMTRGIPTYGIKAFWKEDENQLHRCVAVIHHYYGRPM